VCLIYIAALYGGREFGQSAKFLLPLQSKNIETVLEAAGAHFGQNTKLLLILGMISLKCP